MQKSNETESEKEVLRNLCNMEELAEKKANIYSRLLMDAALAKEMEALALRHQKRRQTLGTLLFGKPPKMKNGQGMSEGNEQ